MARNRRSGPVKPRSPATAAAAPAPAAAGVPLPAAAATPVAPAAPAGPVALPAEVVSGDWTVLLLALMMFLAPALGVPHEAMLQDTLKSVIVAMSALSAAFLLLLQQRTRSEPLRWHGILWLPLLLMVYALGSMVWSHTYLAGVEAVRWFIFAVLAWLALNTLTRDRLPWLAWGIHGGALVAAFWAALQFWLAVSPFPQGPNPASTFINRNFFAEFVVCTLPFSMLLLARARQAHVLVPLAASIGFVLTTIMMTGTRAALLAMWLQLLVLWPLVAWRCRRHFAWPSWSRGLRIAVPAIMLGTVLVLGLIPSGNHRILEEDRGANALQRGIKRTGSIGPNDHSLGIRMIMWRATLNAIAANPMEGLGAGAWESEIPLYQEAGSQLETDYYVHNEFLQLVAEYGVVGWVFLALLLGYLLLCAWRAWRSRDGPQEDEAAFRAVLLCSLFALLLVSNIGFPWRMASTGALFALCLGGLAASDARLGYRGRALAQPLRWSPRIGTAALVASVGCIGLALYITQQAAEAERKIVQATKMALTISASNDVHNPRWREPKRQMLQAIQEGVAINPHYRKITPLVADELARWGDWANATWIYESVLSSRPYVVAIISNAARGYSNTGQPEKALQYLQRAKELQPRAPSVRSLEVILLSREGKEAQALELAKQAIASRVYDFDLVNALFVLAWRAQDYALAERAVELRIKEWPDSQAGAYVQLGNMFLNAVKDEPRAREAYLKAVMTAKPAEKSAVLAQIPEKYR